MKTQTGRNEKCHCNSGKKYKKCCLIADENKRKNGSPELNADLALGEKLVKEYDDFVMFQGGGGAETVRIS